MKREQPIQIGLRVSDQLNKKLDEKAEQIGISKNALMLVLLDLGMKVYESDIKFNLPLE